MEELLHVHLGNKSNRKKGPKERHFPRSARCKATNYKCDKQATCTPTHVYKKENINNLGQIAPPIS
eukprot:1156204-Pelagomonas_calceolata.AAC.10